jgi:hypothetical protein
MLPMATTLCVLLLAHRIQEITKWLEGERGRRRERSIMAREEKKGGEWSGQPVIK